jgi:transcriptional regulator with XRE-family HTH domain
MVTITGKQVLLNYLTIGWVMTDLRKVLAANIKLCRKARGLSQAKLAEIVNISDNYIALMETGRRFPSIAMLERIASALEIDILELFSMKSVEEAQRKTLKTQIMTDIEHILTVRLHEMGD